MSGYEDFIYKDEELRCKKQINIITKKLENFNSESLCKINYLIDNFDVLMKIKKIFDKLSE
jgi:hypothetical protein